MLRENKKHFKVSKERKYTTYKRTKIKPEEQSNFAQYNSNIEKKEKKKDRALDFH